MSLTVKVADALVAQKMFPATDSHDGFMISRVTDLVVKIRYSVPSDPIVLHEDRSDLALPAYASRLQRAGFLVERHGYFLLVSEQPTDH